MNKRITFIFLLLISLFINGCSNDKKLAESDTNNIENIKNVLPNNAEEIGNAEIIISTHTGDSKLNKIPIIHIDKNKLLSQIGFNAKKFKDDKLSYIYIDGKLNYIETLGNISHISLDLYEDALEEGIHKIEVIQFEDNDLNKKPSIYKVVNYKVKLKKV